MSWSDGILGVWHWGKSGLIGAYDYHIRPACPDCTNKQLENIVQCNTDNLNNTKDNLLSNANPRIMSISRLAGLSGAVAIGLGAYGAHVLAADKSDITEDRKKAFDVANR